jgi:hypothetical protein
MNNEALRESPACQRSAADLAPQLEVHAIPVALPCCSPVIDPRFAAGG